MVRPLRLALFAGVAALGAITLAAPPAAAQFALPWGVWAGPPQWMGGEDDFERERIIPPRVVRRILLSQGYRLATAPRLNDDTVVAIGENAQGERVRFIIDGYSGQLLRRVALGGGANFAARNAPDDLSTDNLAPMPSARGDLGGEPAAPKAKPKRKAAPQTAARKPASEAAPKPHTPAPSQAVKTPPAPAPDAPKPEAAKPVEQPAASAAAPAPAEKTLLAPDAASQPKPEAAPATPAPQQAAVPTAPAPADRPALAPETKTPAGSPQEPSEAKPTDIGPRVQPVAPQARAPEAASPVETKPVEPAKPAEANPEKPAQ